MPTNVYECMFLLDTNKVQGDVKAAADQLHEILEKHGAEMLASRPWDERRLAFPIKKHKKGLYYLTYFRCEGNKISVIEEDCKLIDLILRMLVVKIDPKLVEPMLNMARDEHAVALQTVKEDDTFGPSDRRSRGPSREDVEKKGEGEKKTEDDKAEGDKEETKSEEKEPQPSS